MMTSGENRGSTVGLGGIGVERRFQRQQEHKNKKITRIREGETLGSTTGKEIPTRKSGKFELELAK